MAKHLLHTVLVKVLGEFIELDEDNLNLAVWSGQIVLNNLKLKTDTILKNFNLNVFHGSIQRLEVTIPWATLLINPVKIVVSGILLDVGPLDIAKLGKLEALKRYMAEKLQKLKMVDQYLELSLNLKGGATGGENSTANNSSNPNSETYIQQWTTKIIDNVEIRVTDLHIRYEDSLSIPGRVFACGVTLHSFGISTCDGNWELSGSRKGNNSDSTPGRVNKLAYLKCLGIYWQVDASSLANMPQVEWERTMMLYIVREDTSSPYGSFGANDGGISAHIAQAVNSSRNAGVVDAKQYILAPYNNTLTVKLTQNKKPTESVPKFDVRAESSNLQIRLDSVQYTELFSVVDRLVSLGRMYKPKTYRPNERPWDRRSCIAWWKYGCKLAVRLRKYVKLVKLSLRLAAGREDPHQYLPPYAAAEARYLEERLPFEPLRMGRQRAMLELHEEMKKQMRLQEKQQQVEEEPARGGGWWGTWSDSRYGSPVKTKNAGAAVRSDEDISIESILAALNAPEGQQGKGKQAQTTDIVVAMFRFSLESSSTAIISNAQQPLIQVNSALTLSFAQTSAGMTFKCSLQDLLVLDRFTKNPPVPYIISVKSDLSYAQRSLQVLDDPTARARPTFSLMFERISGKSKVVIAALPIELCLNKECIQMVLHTFARPENKYATKERTPKASPRRPQPSALTTAAQQGIENLRNVSQRNDDIQIIFEASAPKIVIPESGEDSGYLLLDCGYLEVKGFLGSSGMSMNMSLYQATVGMPLTVRDMYKFGEKSLYLIKPFDIIMYVQNVDQVVAALTVNVEIKPEIRGEIDSLKLARLLTAMGQISGIFAKLPQPTSDIVTATSAPNMRHLLPASAASSALSLQSSTTASASAHFSPRHQRTPVKATQAPTTTTTTTGLQPTGEHPLALDSSLDAAQDSSFGSVKSPDAESLEFHTPDRNSQGSTPRYSDASSGGNIYGNVYGQFEEFTSGGGGDHHKSSISIKRRESEAKAANRSPEQQAAAQQDPTVCSMRIDLVLPAVALDLTYDVHKGYHLVLEVKSLRTTMLSRLHDRSINFEMGAVSMRDSFRAAAQRDLIWTPPESGKLVRVSYVNVTSKESPLYVRHATDIVMKFANLGLNVDVNTINHLRPFFEVLLSSRQPAAPEQDQPASPAAGSSGGTSPHPSQSQSNSAGVSAYASNSSLAGMLMDDDPNTPPSGTSVTASLERISLDFLRASTNEKMGALLETAFSAQISGMRCDLDMKGLMKAEIRLRSFEIIDVRHISGDYVFKKIFCPAFESHEAGSTAPDDVSGDENDAVRDASFEQDPDVSMSSIGYANSLVGLDTGFTSPMTAQSKSPRHKAIDENLLYVVFKQESKVHNHFDIVISNITSFIAIDTILDLTNVALANVFAFFGLLAAPAPKLPDILLAQPKAVGQPPPPTNTADMTGSRSDKMYTPNSSSKKVSGGPVESPSSDSGTPHAAAEKDPGTASILSAVLHIRSPRLIFLEDPSSEESQAIVGTCGVILNYTRETTTRASGVSMYESLHVTLSKYEVYVLKSMMRWYPQPILEPVEVEVHLKKRSVDGVTRMMNAHVELDNVNAQVSFNDILLAQSILSRRILSEAPPAGSNPEPPTPAPPPVAVNTPAAVAEACGEDDPEDGTLPQSSGNVNQPALLPPAEPSVMSFQFGMGTLAMVIINDFNGQSTPIIKTSISNSHFGMESVGPSVSGDGALDAKVDFFNPRLSSWEPILDMWQPTARIYSMNDSKIFEVKSNYTMQLTVSGIILETLLRSYSLFFHELDLLGERTSVAGICVHNQLGEDVVVELYDSASKRKLVALSGNQIGAISNLQDHAGKIWSKALNLPSSVDLHFVGRFQSLRMPLFHLPLNVNKPKAYNLQPIAPRSGENTPDEKDEASSVWTTKAAKVYVIEPIVEEVFENSRYDPIMGCWRKPYFMGDPYEWTDGSGTIRRDIGSIEIASDKWEWQGKWEIDMDGQIGKEIDAQGWEYASSFNFFTMVSLRRCSQAMDGCRRRRWTRTRIPRASSQGLQERPLTLFWDVKSLKDGSRKVDLRSALQFSNQLAFPIIISLQHNAWDREVELGPIGTDEVFSVPLLYSYANAVRFRPDFPLYNWSPYFPCNVHTYDFSTTKSTNCSGQAIDVNAVWFRLVTSQVNKSVLVSVVPFLTITNKLLCDMRFICTDTYQKSESGEIESGREKKLSHINVSSQPILSIKVGNFEWSESIELITSADSASLFELHLPGRKKGNKLYLSMNSKICPTRGLSIEIFSKVAIIDRTSLHLFVASKLRPGVNLVRSTCATLRDSGNSSSNNSGGGNSTTGMVAANRERIDSTASSKVGGVDSESMVSEATVSGLQLKVPSSDSRSTLRRPSRPNLLTDPGAGSGDISPVLSGFANPVRNAFSYRSNFPETATVKVDNTPIVRGRKAGVAVHLRADGLHTGSRAAADVDSLASVQLPAHAPVPTQTLIRDIEVCSRNKYQLILPSASQRVYSDHAMRWGHLPPCFLDQLQLRTPFEDRLQRSTRLVQFTASTDCMLLLLVDINAPLKWLLVDGFIKLREIATARSVTRGNLEETHFAIYGKICHKDQRVVLKSSWNKTTLTMYTLFFLPLIAAVAEGSSTAAVTGASTNSGPGTGSATVTESHHDSDDTAAMRADSLDSVLRQLNYKDVYSRELATRSWTEGSNHLSLMYTYDNIVTVGLCKGKVWSREINIDTRKNAASKGSFEVENAESNISYQLSYGLHALPGLYSETQLIYFMPKYCILNCTEEVLLVSQRGSEKYLQYLSYKPEGWHKLELDSGTDVQFRTASTLWSLGAVDINDIGSSVLYIPFKEHTIAAAESSQPGAPPTQRGIVLHIEVKLADPTDHCSIIVIVWQETIESRAAMSIRNSSDVPITIRQADIEMDHEIQNQEHLFELCVPPGASLPFGWADPESGNDVLVTVGEGIKGQNKRIASINMLKTEQMLRLPYNFGRLNAKGEVVISVSTNNSGHVLEISNLTKRSFLVHDQLDGAGGEQAPEAVEDLEARQRTQGFPTYGFNFVLSSFGISLVVEKPQRREFVSLYVDWLEVLVRMKGNMRSLEFMIMDLQVDNYSETVIYPVLLRSSKKEIRRSVALSGSSNEPDAGRQRQESNLLSSPQKLGEEATSDRDYQRKPDDPFIKLTMVQEVPADGTQAIFKYVACRVLPLVVEVDSATVQLLFTDLLDDLKILTRSQALALSVPDLWLNEFNMRQLYPQQQLRMVNVYRSKIQAQQSKMYFKKLIIHPVKITFTFAQTTFPRRLQRETLQSTVLNVLMSLVGVEKLRLHLRSFEVEDAMESLSTLADMINSKSMQDVRSQLTQIAGSLTMLGSPIGFARRVGSGVKAFFYEPYQGAVHGSGDFFLGLGRGTSTLFSGVVSGAMDSAVAIVGTASKGISHLSGDADYVRKRAIKRQQSKVNRGGILEGMREGGESVISGISAGVTGLVSKPIEEASKTGIHGFFKGLGLGLIGAAVKPVIGLSDGLTSVAQGISNQVDPGLKTSHVRPPRALEPSPIDPSILMVVPLNLEAAFAQEFVFHRAKQNHYDDAFLRYIPLESKGEAIILSSVYVYWRRKASLWGRVWANVSHCVYMTDAVGIMLYSGGKNGGASLVTIPCKSIATAKRVYAALAENTARMGNPSNVIPVDIVMKVGTGTGGGSSLSPSGSREQDLHTLLRDGRRITQSTSEVLRQVVDESQLGALDGYRFGAANGAVLTQITGSEDDILKRATHHLEKEIGTWQRVDQHIWRLLWEWGCIHSNLSACRCSVTVLINRSDSPIQITRVQLLIGRNVLIIGSNATGYETESRSLMPEGMMIVFISAFPESPLDIGHLKANINTAAFSAVLASTQRESFCEAKGGFTVGFLEKTVSDWWSKYVIVIS